MLQLVTKESLLFFAAHKVVNKYIFLSLFVSIYLSVYLYIILYLSIYLSIYLCTIANLLGVSEGGVLPPSAYVA